MNLGQAVAVCLYEMIRDPKAATLTRTPSRPMAKTWSGSQGFLDEALSKSGTIPAVTEGSTELKLRRLIRRMNLNGHDAKMWMGMVRQVFEVEPALDSLGKFRAGLAMLRNRMTKVTLHYDLTRPLTDRLDTIATMRHLWDVARTGVAVAG